MNLQGQDPEIAHHFFDLWQDSLESQFSKMLADHRPCHYAIDNGSGQVIWVPKHSPCWFESQSGKLIIDTHTNGSRWSPALHSGPAKLMQVCLTSSVGMEEPTVAVPGLSFPRRQAWQKLPTLELNLSEVYRADCCPLARVRIYTEELRALRTALQLMVKRAEAKSTAEASLQPASSAMEPIQEGGSEADGSGSSPAEEEATPEPAQGDADPPRASQPHAPAEAAHTKSRSASPARGCGCFGFGSRRPSSAKLPNKAADQSLSQALDGEPTSTPSEKAATNIGPGSLGSESVPGDAAVPGTNGDDSAMLFYHEMSLPDAGPNGGPATPTTAEQTERERGLRDDSAMAFDASQDVSAGNSAVHPMPTGLSGGIPRITLQTLESRKCAAPSPLTEGPADTLGGLPSPGDAVRRKRATGASLPTLMLSTVQAIGLEGSHGFSRSVPLRLDALGRRHPDNGNAAETQFLDTARGPRGAYRDAPRGTQQAAQLNEHMSLPIRWHVWDAARMVAESRAACKEVWAPGYDHSPGQSDSEDHQGAATKEPSVASPKPAQGSALLLESSQQDSQSPDVQSIPPPVGDHPFLLATVPIELQSPPKRYPDSPAEEQSILLIQPSVEVVTAAMSKLGSLNISGQSMGSQGSMLPSESRKLAHVALRAEDVSAKSRHLSATPGDILRMRQALGRFPESGLSAPPDRQATQPLLAAQPAQNGPELPMQPALSLVDWTNVQAVTVLGKEHQSQSPRQDDAGDRSNSDVEIDSPFASNSLPREGQQSLPRRINKYAGTSDTIYEDLNNPFDKYRGPPRARRGRNQGKRNSTGSKGSSRSPSKSPATAATPAAEPDLAGSPATRLHQSASASDEPARSADTSSTASPTRGAGMAPDSSAALAPGYTSGGTTSPGSFTDDSENTQGTPQDTPSEAYAEQVQSGAIAVAASELAAESQPAAATVIVSGGAESLLHSPHDTALIPAPGFPSHPEEAAAAKGPALQDASSSNSFTHPGSQPVDIPSTRETEIAEADQAGQAAEIPAIGVSAILMVLEPEISQQAQRQNSAVEGDTYYDAVPEQASLLPPASAAASSALEAQASPSEQTEPGRAEPAQDSPSHAPAQHPEAQQEPETPTSHHASSTAESLGQVIGSTRQTVKESHLAVAGTVQSKDAEKHVAVSLRVRRSKQAGMVAATIAALGLSSKARQTPPEPIRVCITPLKEALSRSRVALDPDQMDATWYSSLLMSSTTPARGPRQPPALSSGNRAATQRSDAKETPDRAAVAAARLTEAGRGPKNGVRYKPPPAPEAKAALSSQDDPVVNMSEAPIPNVRHNLLAAVDQEGEPPEEVAPADEAAAVSSAMGVRHGSVHPSAQAAADVALLPADGISTAGPSGETLPETASRLLKAPSIQKQLDKPGIAATGLETPIQDAGQSMYVTPQTGAPPKGASPEQRVLRELPDQAAANITPADQARHAATALKQRIESPQQHSEAAAAAAGRTGSAALPPPAKPRWERSDQPMAAATLGGGAMLARCASDAAQQAQRNRALVSELKQHLQTSGPRPSAGPTALKRRPSVQSPVIALGSPHERGLLYKPEMQSVADRVRYIEHTNSRNAPPLSALTAQSSLPHLSTTSQAAAL